MSNWPQDVVVRLQALWAEGHSTAEIGRRLGSSKNAIVGKAHRLGLPARPSPIKRASDGEEKPKAPARLYGPPPVPIQRVREIVAQKAPAYSPFKTCQFPAGDPKALGFHFCNSAQVVPGRPYCADHTAVAYRSVRDLREDVA